MNLFTVIVFIGAAVALGGLVCRLVARPLDDITFHDTAPDHAGFLVAQFAEGTYENRFGFPTGFFAIDEKKTDPPNRYLFVEAQPMGSVTDGCAAHIGAFGASGIGEGGAGCLMVLVSAMMAAPFVAISFVDRLYRSMMRSKIQIDVRASGTDSIVSIAFYGIVGYLLRSRYAAAFAAPTLPEELAHYGRPEATTATSTTGPLPESTEGSASPESSDPTPDSSPEDANTSTGTPSPTAGSETFEED
jgi:hypothetical protein